MDAELMRTVRTLEVDDYQDSLEDPIGHHERAKAGFKRLSRNSVEKLFSLRAATVAEIRKRRAESPWKGSFTIDTARTFPTDTVYSEDGMRITCSFIPGGLHAVHACAALNAYYGYDAQGNDLLEGMGV